MKVKVGIDIDGCISEYPKLFSTLTQELKNSRDIEIFILTSREDSSKKEETVKQLEDLGIVYNHLIFSDNKVQSVRLHGINLFIDNEDENFQGIPSEVCCLKIREEGNYCFGSYRWYFSRKTGKEV